MGRTLQSSETENRSKGDNERQTEQALFRKLCTRKRPKLEQERAFFSRSSTASVFSKSVLLSTSSDNTVATFVTDEKIPQVLIATEPEPFQIDEFESDSECDYDETESEEIVEHRNAITRSSRQIKASMRFNL